MPDYEVRFDYKLGMLMVRSRGILVELVVNGISIPALDQDVYELARQAAPSWDI